MAKVPFVGVNSPFGNRGPDRPTPMNADTRGVTNGMEAATSAVLNLGGQAVDYMEKQRKEMDDSALIDLESKASNIENELVMNPETGAYLQRGQNAIGLRERTLAEFDKQSEDLLADTPGSIRQRAVILQKRRRMQLEDNLFRHETQETEKYHANQAAAGIENTVNNAALYYDDPDRVTWEANRAEVYATKLADMRGDGVDAETRTLGVKKAVSAVYEGVIDRKLQSDPYEAERYAADNKGKLTAEAQLRVLEKVDPYVRAAEYDVIAADIEAGNGARGPADFSSLVEQVLNTEGGYNASDGHSKAPVNFGINQAANPDIDVKNMTREDAIQIYRERYWQAAGIDKVPASVRGQMFDTAVNMGVDTAKRLYKKSGGDAAKFADLRRAEYRALVEKRPSDAKHLKGWLARVDKYAGSAGFEAPKTATQAIAIANQTIEDPRARREVAERLRQSYRLKDEAERDNQASFAMGAYDRILKSKGETPLEKMFTPEEMRNAYKWGYLDNFRELQRQQALGTQPVTDVKLYETLRRESILSPETFAKRNIMALSARLGTDDLVRLMGFQKDLNKPLAGQPDFIEESKQLGMAYMDIGIDGEKNAGKRKEFEATYYKEVEGLVKATGKKPSQKERQEIINRMKLPFVREGWFSDDKVPAYKAEPGKDKVPAETRSLIIEALKKAGMSKPTEADIMDAYYRSAGSSL